GLVVNGWDNVKDNNSAKSIGVNFTVKPISKIVLIGNFLYGKENPNHDDARQLYEGIITVTPFERLSLTGDFVYGEDHLVPAAPGFPAPKAVWKGFAGYSKLKLSEKMNLNGRYEYFTDRDGLRTGTVQALQSGTVTAQ